MNLIITCPRNTEEEAENEIINILKEFDEIDPQITITKMSGILTVTTTNNPIEIIKKIRKKINDEPWYVRYCLRMIPIQGEVKTEIDKITNEVQKLVNCIKKNDSFRITIEKRNSNISSKEIITKIAEKMSNIVSLDHPDWIILIEILGNNTGVSVIKNDDVLSVEIVKRTISD